MNRRLFNVAGPCIPGEHYMLDAAARCPGLRELIDSKHFFVVHAARQTGKTTLLNNLEHRSHRRQDHPRRRMLSFD